MNEGDDAARKAGETPAGEQAAGAAPAGEPPAAGEPAAAGGPVARLRALPLAVKAAIGVVVVGAVVLGVLLTRGAGPLPDVTPPAASLADPVPYDGRSPVQPPGPEQRVLVQLRRPALGALPDARSMGAEDQKAYLDSLRREATTLRSALQARGVVLRDVVGYYRVWNGFSATVSTRDLARLNSPGVRVRTVRRAYPASGEPVPVPGKPRLPRAGLGGQPPVAVLDTGVDSDALQGHADPGYDAVDRDRDPAPGRDPGGSTRRETSGTALAGVVAEAGERVLPIRIASLRAVGGKVEASTTTDVLLSGLEHAVDPNGDSDTSDHVPVALVGVNAPYAGFTNSPEAEAVEGAAGLGTLVVAPAGNEGAAAPGSGTVGSPASAREALAVGALTGAEPSPRVEIEGIGDAAVLGGDPPDKGTTAGPVEEPDPAVLGKLQTRIRGKVVIVRAGANPTAQAATAAAVGAAAVVLADPRERALPAMPAGRAAAPVIGVTGEAAEAVLDLEPGSEISFGETERGPSTDAPAAISPLASQGPSAGGLPKPDLAAPASAVTLGPGGTVAVAGGSAIAAARAAATAGRLARTRPELSPAQLRQALIAAADPANLPPDRAGAGVLRDPQPSPGVVSDPPTAVSGALDPVHVELSTAASTRVTLRATDGASVDPQTVDLTPGTPTEVRVRLERPGITSGRLEALDPTGKTVASIPWLVRLDEVEPIEVGPLKVSAGGRRVRFTLGTFKRGERTTVHVAERLILDLVDDDDNILRTLTFPGGARELMPAEYGYTLPRDEVPDGDFKFRVRAWAPRQDEPTTRTS
ncbi:MAG TPA: S8 family serine peptidase [Solirubrobacter sp.]|nr:S8 family serine peptidase [Solirubrobacter sp.]